MNDTVESATARLDQAERIARRVVTDRNLPSSQAERETARPEYVPVDPETLGNLERLKKKFQVK